VISVEDDGAGMDEAALRTLLQGLENGFVPSSRKSGMGMANVMRRISLFFEDGQRVQERVVIQSAKGKGTCVRIRIPYREG
jgi:two-component system sensor histidine kinase YesM